MRLEERQDDSALGVEAERRRSLGIYYTPPSAAQILAGWAIRTSRDTVLEPSFGGCSLLQAALNRLALLGCHQPAQHLHGFDVDPSAFSFLRRLIGPQSQQFHLRDFLDVWPSPSRKVTSVLANPPFVSYHGMSPGQRTVLECWRAAYKPKFPATASLWAYFLIHAISFLAPSGRLAFVLPAALVTADYAKPILEDLRRLFARVWIFRMTEQLFIQAGAEERTVLLLADGYQSQRGESASFVDVFSDLDGVARAVELDSSPCNRSFASDVDPSNIDALRNEADALALGEMADVAIGEVVGDTPYFVKSSEAWKQLAIDEKYMAPILTRMRQAQGIRLTSREVSSLYSMVPRVLRIENRRVSTALKSYLDRYPVKARDQNVTFAKRRCWFSLSYECDASAFVSSWSHDGPRIVLNAARITCGNGLYKLKAKAGSPWRSSVAVAALSTLTQLSAELLTRTRGAGALKLEPKDVRALLIPAAFREWSAPRAKALIAKVDGMLRAGQKDAARRAVDDELMRAGVLHRSKLEGWSARLAALRKLRLGAMNR